jgi:hypothetical protein
MIHLLYPGMASAATIALHYFAGLAWGWAALLCFVAWPLVGTLVTADDDLPGGWSNPDGTVRPPWLEASSWGRISMGLAVASFVGALDMGWRSRTAEVLAGVGVIAGLLGTVLLRRGDRARVPSEPVQPSGGTDETT